MALLLSSCCTLALFSPTSASQRCRRYTHVSAAASGDSESIPPQEQKEVLPLNRNYFPSQEQLLLDSSDWNIIQNVNPETALHPPNEFNRRSFPPGFLFGASTSAFQVEGAASEGGRGPSIWDTFTENHPEKIIDQSNAKIAIDHYHQWLSDVEIMSGLHFDAYRLSISWSRILPKGTLRGGINQTGVQFYSDLIDKLNSKGIEPFVTLFHWDLPQALEDQYQGLLSPRIVDDFRDYADLCFQLFGDRVKYWITFNEPLMYCRMGYSQGSFPPGRCSTSVGGPSSIGNSGIEPYIAAHHLILAHAAAVEQFRKSPKKSPGDKIGITLNSLWYLPYHSLKADCDAVSRVLDFELGWFMDPLTNGDYPFNMRVLVGDRLPLFTVKQSRMVQGSFDFIGVNYYTTNYASSNISLLDGKNVSYDNDMCVTVTGVRDGIPIGTPATSWLHVYPRGIKELLVYIKDKYNNPDIYITENGVCHPDDPKLDINEAMKDEGRVEYLWKHLFYVRQAMSEGVQVKGYLTWSVFDNFEWLFGYTLRFGLVHIDYKDRYLKRTPKNSARWFGKFLEREHPHPSLEIRPLDANKT